MRINIPVRFAEHKSTYPRREYTCTFSFIATDKNYGDKQMRIHQESTTACEILLVF
jgi:hypothetical protein